MFVVVLCLYPKHEPIITTLIHLLPSFDSCPHNATAVPLSPLLLYFPPSLKIKKVFYFQSAKVNTLLMLRGNKNKDNQSGKIAVTGHVTRVLERSLPTHEVCGCRTCFAYHPH